MKCIHVLSTVIVLFVADHGYAGPRRFAYRYPVYPAYYPYPRIIVAPVVIRPAVNPVVPVSLPFIPGNAAAANTATAAPRMERFVRLENKTSETLTVSLLYRTRDEQGRWVWLPDDPAGDRVMSFSMEPGKVLDLTGKVSAGRIRIWAESASRKWSDYQRKDLLLVPEPEGMYLSSRVETFTFTFDRK